MKRLSCLEKLEPRYARSSDWHNADLPCDVNESGRVTALDALLVINAISRGGLGPRILTPENALTDRLVDTNHDGHLSAVDALRVINTLAKYRDPLTLSISNNAVDQDSNGIIVASEIILSGSTLPEANVEQ